MKNFFLLALAGVIAQLVDGSLGMAYGVSSTTVLLAAGVAPALASAAVHMAEIGTTAVSGISHSSFGNVDWSKIVWLAVPGGVGALLGALGLVVNAVVLWNTRYLDAALTQVHASSMPVKPEDVERLSPLLLDHVNVLGRYDFALTESVRQGRLRPLRTPAERDDLAA